MKGDRNPQKMKDILLIYRGQVIYSEIVEKINKYKNDNITLVVEDSINVNTIKLILAEFDLDIITSEHFLNKDYMKKFDAIVGNPPYQDGSKAGGQNKIYNQFCKKVLKLIKDDGVIHLITPTSVLKKSKRFSLHKMGGLKVVDFTTGDAFDEGINICSWLIDKKYRGNVKVVHSDGTEFQSNDELIYDYSEIDRKFTKIYQKLKELTDTPDKRMFRQNNHGPALSKVKDRKHIHPQYKIEKGSPILMYYSSKSAYNSDDEKCIIPITKSLNKDSVFVDILDYDHNYMFKPILFDGEVENIKSFILSEYFIEHSNKWKQIDGYGFNTALKYLPPFDTSKKWSNKEVKEFIEGFIDEN